MNECLIDLLIDELVINGCANQMVDWSILSIGLLMDRLIDRLMDRLIAWSMNRLTE